MGPVLGLVVMGAGLAAAELVVGLFERTASPVVPVGQVFIDWVPRPLKDWAIETFGTNDKVVLVLGALVVLLGIGVGVGVLAMRGARAAAVVLTCITGVIGAWAVLTRPEPTLVKLLPTIVGTAVSVGVLLYLAPRPSNSSTSADPPQPIVQPMGVDRRRFVGGAIGIGSVAVIAGGVGRLLQQRFEVSSERSALSLPPVDAPATVLPADAQLPLDGLGPFVTPNADFYRIDTALVVPQVSKDSWRLKIGGMVDNPMELTFDDLLARPQVERYITLSCVSNPIGGDLVGNALLAGRAVARRTGGGRSPGGGDTDRQSIDRRLDRRHPDRDRDGRARCAAGDRHERRAPAGPTRLSRAHGGAGSVRLRVGDEVGHPDRADPLGGLRRLLGAARAGRRRGRSRRCRVSTPTVVERHPQT